MKQFILAVLLLVTTTTFAQQRPPLSLNVNTNQCLEDFSVFKGGGDLFPWSVARPFPWTSVEGLWKSVDPTKSNIIFEFKVTRTTEKLKQLLVLVYDLKKCKSASISGVGLINNSEKNVVRVNMNNVMLKLAMFKTQDLELKTLSCGVRAMGASFYKLSDELSEFDSSIYGGQDNVEDSANLLLKKISDTTAFKCK